MSCGTDARDGGGSSAAPERASAHTHTSRHQKTDEIVAQQAGRASHEGRLHLEGLGRFTHRLLHLFDLSVHWFGWG